MIYPSVSRVLSWLMSESKDYHEEFPDFARALVRLEEAKSAEEIYRGVRGTISDEALAGLASSLSVTIPKNFLEESLLLAEITYFAAAGV